MDAGASSVPGSAISEDGSINFEVICFLLIDFCGF